MVSSRIASFLAGMLIANSSPHLASAITRRRHMTPLAGRDSGRVVNGAWAALNLAGAIALLQPSRRRGGEHWDADLPAFELGCLTFAAWMAAVETAFPNAGWSNHRR